jgi:glycerol-3-phosphate dehydrogenase
LEHFDFALVREALIERTILTHTAPHLTEAFPFVIPIYKNPHRNYDYPLKVRAGLLLYDILAGSHGFERHRKLSAKEALELGPQLDPHGLKGAFLYYDARTDDSRLVIEVIKAAHESGAAIANYARVSSLLKNDRGKIDGARLCDQLTNQEIETRARIVINSTGVWMEDVLRLNTQPINLPKIVRPAKGIHLTIPLERLPIKAAWLIPSLKDHRFYFVVPWQGRINIGTTDTDYHGDKDAPSATGEEVTEILNAINSYFPHARLQPSDLISTWAGLRPLITDPRVKNTTEVSRKEELFETPDEMISISGGKLTTYRQMAEDTVDLAARRLRERHGILAPDSKTKKLPIGGGGLDRYQLASVAAYIAQSENLGIESARHLVYAYGSDYARLIDLMREDKELREPLLAGLPHLAAEIVYAARYEMVVTLADAMTRRTRLAMLVGRDSLKCVPIVADLLASELGWSEEGTGQQIEAFICELEREFAVPG